RGGALNASELGTFLTAEGLLTAFQAHQLLKGKWRGFSLGRYKILKPLGKGMMGHVFLAHQTDTHRLVALKVVAAENLAPPSLLARFHIEARALASLDHPNIVRAYGIDEQKGKLFLVLEYVEGISLTNLVNTRGPLEVPRAVDVIRQAAFGLQHAHDAGWVH